MQRISDHLDSRRLIGTRLLVEPPRYRGLTVVARVIPDLDARPDRVQEAALRALYGYLSPLDGGSSGTGWVFGRPVQAFDVYSALARVPGVDRIEDLLLFPAEPDGTRGAPVERLDLEPGALVLSYQHQVRVQSMGGRR